MEDDIAAPRHPLRDRGLERIRRDTESSVH